MTGQGCMTDGRWATSSLEWILLYEAFAAFQVKAESYGLYTEEIKRIEKDLFDHCPLPKPKKMEVL